MLDKPGRDNNENEYGIPRKVSWDNICREEVKDSSQDYDHEESEAWRKNVGADKDDKR